MSEICINPAAIRDGDLMAYVDGIAEQAVVEHLHRCPTCTRVVEEVAILQSALITKLYRHSCPGPDLLIAHRQGKLK